MFVMSSYGFPSQKERIEAKLMGLLLISLSDLSCRGGGGGGRSSAFIMDVSLRGGMCLQMYQAHQEMEKFDRETERRQLEAAEALRLQQMQVPNGTAPAPAAGPSQARFCSASSAPVLHRDAEDGFPFSPASMIWSSQPLSSSTFCTGRCFIHLHIRMPKPSKSGHERPCP